MNRLQGRARVMVFMLGGLLVGVLLGILIVAGGPGLAGANRQPPAVGLRAPDFSLSMVSGEKLRLSALKGRPVVINFWATWCGPCKEEMPLFEAYAKKTGDQVVWLGVNELESAETVNAFIQELNITFPILLDLEGQVAQDYYVRGYPATYFVDADGIIRAQHLGQIHEELLIVYLETIGFKP